jgi:hypothetical protein
MSDICHICKRPLSGPGSTYCSAPHTNPDRTMVRPAAPPAVVERVASVVADIQRHTGPDTLSSVYSDVMRDWCADLQTALTEVDATDVRGVLDWLKGLEACIRYGTKLNESDLPAIEQVRTIIASMPAPPGWQSIETADADLEFDDSTLGRVLAAGQRWMKRAVACHNGATPYNVKKHQAAFESAVSQAVAQRAILVDALQKIATGEVDVFDEDTGGNVSVAMDMEEASKIARAALTQAKPRYEVVNDGPDRWVLVDNWSDDPAPVYETRGAAYRALIASAAGGTGEP